MLWPYSVLLTADLHTQQLAQLVVRRLLDLGGTVGAAGGAQCAAVTLAAQALGGSNTGLSTGNFLPVVLVLVLWVGQGEDLGQPLGDAVRGLLAGGSHRPLLVGGLQGADVPEGLVPGVGHQDHHHTLGQASSSPADLNKHVKLDGLPCW